MDVSSLFRLDGRVALVTGGSRGIGQMIAEGFIAAGATVYVTSRKADACEATAAALGPMCHALPGDISTVAGVQELARALGEREQRLDILINNAGAAWAAPLAEFPENGWDKVMSLNVKTPFFLVQALLPMLKAAGKPSKIINIASVDGLRPNPWGTYSYTASKAALIHLTRRLAAELIADGIVVTALAPGAFPSEMNRAAREDAEGVAKAIPAGRVGDAQDIAAAAIYLASRAGDYVVGSTLAVDGGIVNASYFGAAD